MSPAGKLFDAIARGDQAAVVDLLDHSPDLVWAADTQKKTALHLAAEHDHAAIAAILIDLGADMNAQTLAGVTPLQAAQSRGSAKAAKLLTERTGVRT